MVNITINNIKTTVPDGTTILKAAEINGFHIPTLCFLKDISEIGACRVCVVEIDGIDRLVTSCNNICEENMSIHTNSPKVRSARRTIIELILSQHDCHCSCCARGGNCTLQKIANDLGIIEIPYKEELLPAKWSKDFPFIHDNKKCIKCMRCVQICEKVQSLGIWDVMGTGSRTIVDVAQNRPIEEADCAICGQCVTHCPVGALRERDDVQKVIDALSDPEKIKVVQIAPAVRAAWGEPLGISREFATVNRLVAALRKIGFNYIFDTNFSADLTIMEESSEFLDKYLNKKEELPLFTSCCPGWVRFMKSQYPQMVKNLSTAKSPQQMFGAVAKSWYAKLLNVSPDKIYCVSIMPCIAKKHECEIPNMNSAGAGQDVDVVLSTREVSRLIRAEQIRPDSLVEEPFDTPLGAGSGAAVIFGASGGVMEAALRTAYKFVVGENPSADAFKNVRGMDGWKEAEYSIEGNLVRVAIANGLGNARKLIEALRRKEVHYDFVEIMACPGGCAGGGGQPIVDGMELATDRADVLYNIDSSSDVRFSHENTSVLKCYEDYFEEPLSHKSHDLLHTDHEAWTFSKAHK